MTMHYKLTFKRLFFTKTCVKTCLSLLVFQLFIHNITAQLNVVADRKNATYHAGELMHFDVTSNASGQATYSIKYDERSPSIETGTIDLVAGTTTKIPFSVFESCFVLCEVQQYGQSSRAAAAFSPYDIAPYEDEPADFDAFWNSMKQQLAAVPMNPNISFYSSTSRSTTYRVNLANIEGRRVYGWLTIPNGEGPFPASLVMPSFGSGPFHVRPRDHTAEHTGMIIFAISIHNAEPDQGDFNAYQPNDISKREGNYYRFALMGAVRAIDYIYTRPEFDGNNMMVMGVSQGGGLSISVAGLDNRIKAMINSVPALCQHSGMRYGKTSGHPYFIFKSRTENGSTAHEQGTIVASHYYDAMNFAKRFKGPSLSFMSYEDVTCPPGTVFAANNQIDGTKVIYHRREAGHDQPDYFTDARFDFVRKHFPQTINNSPANPSFATGYYANAGDDQTTSIGQAINLNGSIQVNGIENTWFPVQWEKVSGAGKVQFSDNNSHSTTATFSKAGTYVLRFVGQDTNFPEQDAKWVSVLDYVTIVVQ